MPVLDALGAFCVEIATGPRRFVARTALLDTVAESTVAIAMIIFDVVDLNVSVSMYSSLFLGVLVGRSKRLIVPNRYFLGDDTNRQLVISSTLTTYFSIVTTS